ncbi:hypothetical protein DEJ35_13340 [Curtobacterium sp. MCPF17_051]|nr:hypothetical protein DEJ35_13340 [Curtobacterium sp. MCPF17_051]
MTDVTTTTRRADPDAAVDGFEGGWFRIDDEVELLDDVVWRPAAGTEPGSAAAPAAVIVRGDPREHIGSTLPLARLDELDRPATVPGSARQGLEARCQLAPGLRSVSSSVSCSVRRRPPAR